MSQSNIVQRRYWTKHVRNMSGTFHKLFGLVGKTPNYVLTHFLLQRSFVLSFGVQLLGSFHFYLILFFNDYYLGGLQYFCMKFSVWELWR